MTTEKERIFKMLKSEDEEMVTLGVSLALSMGIPWCIDNLTITGERIEDLPSGVLDKCYTKNKMAIIFNRGFLQVIYNFSKKNLPKNIKLIKLG